MLRAILLFCLFQLTISNSRAQNPNLDSLFRIIDQLPADTSAFDKMLNYSDTISFRNPSLGILIDQRILGHARELEFQQGEAQALNSVGEDYHFLGNFVDALRMQLEALNLNRSLKDLNGEAYTLPFIGILYNELGQYRQALSYLIRADSLYHQFPSIKDKAFALANISNAYESLGRPDSALYYAREAYKNYNEGLNPHLKSFLLGTMGSVYASIGKTDSALMFLHAVIQNARKSDDQLNLLMTFGRIARIHYGKGDYDSSLFYSRLAFRDGKKISSRQNIFWSANLLADLFERRKALDSANIYLRIAAAMKDSLYGADKLNKMQILLLNEQQNQHDIQQQELDFKNRIKYIALFIALGIFLLIAFILFRSNRNKQKANNLLQEQKKKIEETLTELKSAQAQLVQSEKMASLGELTAGIAHEIQNPLNFVNNFSELNKELIDEMNAKLDQGDIGDAKMVADAIKNNLEKINHHGQRADGIVKGMLQHSRVSAGKREPTDINTLCNEYIRLAYLGQRARDHAFHTKIETHFDESLPKANIIPQDMGRVLLNLINNAFYSVSEKDKARPNGYEPAVILSTRKNGQSLEIRIKDNGLGISAKNLDKIFQPFFTTRPTGQGTGLGLSISYDIVQAHGGEVLVKSIEGEGAEFIVSLPVL